jgi:hypothetical protein
MCYLKLFYQKHGGSLVSSPTRARIIIADPATKYYHNLVKKYEHDTEVYVETPEWIAECIANKKYKHVLEVKVVGGRAKGSRSVCSR